MNTYNLTLLVAGVDEEHLDEIYEATDGAANVELGDRWTSTVGYDIQATRSPMQLFGLSS